jgi:hypothetical protein
MSAAKRSRIEEEEATPSYSLVTNPETANELQTLLEKASAETQRFVRALLVRGADHAIRYNEDEDVLWEENNKSAAATFATKTVLEQVLMISALTSMQPYN